MVKPISDNPYDTVPGDADSKVWRLRFGLLQTMVKDLENEIKDLETLFSDQESRIYNIEILVGIRKDDNASTEETQNSGLAST